MNNFYNEIDPYAAAWLRNLIAADHIAPGVVDERSIVEIQPAELAGYTQCHFFAGIGIWSYALRRAGWADDRPVWTGSCPCQPFSGAGKGKGHEDERHLWPAWQRLIAQCRPDSILGEQVSGPDGLAWLDLVCTDLENGGYAVGAIVATAAGVGAPHGRHRIYFVANPWGGGRDQGIARDTGKKATAQPDRNDAAGRGGAGDMDHTGGIGREPRRHDDTGDDRIILAAAVDAGDLGDTPRGGFGVAGIASRHTGLADGADQADTAGGHMAYSERGRGGCEIQAADHGSPQGDGPADRVSGWCSAPDGMDDTAEPGLALWGDDQDAGRALGQEGSAAGSAGPVNGFWTDAEWVLCRDPQGPRWRPIEPGSFPVASGAAGRVGRLRAYGNGLNASTAEAFVRAVMA